MAEDAGEEYLFIRLCLLMSSLAARDKKVDLVFVTALTQPGEEFFRSFFSFAAGSGKVNNDGDSISDSSSRSIAAIFDGCQEERFANYITRQEGHTFTIIYYVTFAVVVVECSVLLGCLHYKIKYNKIKAPRTMDRMGFSFVFAAVCNRKSILGRFSLHSS